MAEEKQEKTVIRGTVEDVIFRSPDSDYAVIEIDCEGELITAVGELASVSEGEEITAFGQFVSHPTYGSQFRCEGCQITLPTTSAAILKFLSGKAVQGIGQVIARRLVEAFGDSTLEVMAKEPEKLEKIKGLTRKKAQDISSEVSRIFGLTETVRNLSAMGLSTGDSLLLYNAFGYDATSLISDNPYMLCEYPVYKEFTAADQLAEDLLIPETDFRRIRAALINTLRHNLGNGHTCLPTERLIDVTANYISVNRDDVEIELYRSAEEGVFCQLKAEEGELTFLRDMYDAENYIAERLRSLTSTRYFEKEDAGSRIDRFQERTGIEYEPQQRAAIMAAMSSGAVVITGGPGTGKTTTVNAILALCEEKGDRVALCAPTGRAAKRMTELTGKEARTIHRLLEVGYGSRENIRFIHNEENPLKYDVVIIDEMSMVDSQLFCSLLKGIKPWCRLVLVGDDHQLPSVGAGNVLKDIIASGICETIELEKIFRQAAESLIVVNAHAIVEGSAPDLKRRDKDFFFLDTEKENMPDLITDLVYRRLPKSYGLDPLDDIQVITPSRLGLSGTGTLNDSLRDRLNPAAENKREVKVGALTVREGDKVMQTRNNYDIEWTRDDGEEGVGVFNGDIGIVSEIDTRDGIISIRFDDRVARFDLDQARQLEEAYAITVHKSQGSEFPAVILAVGDTPRKLCYRNLLYTAVTRARSLLIIAGNEDLISLMVNNDRKMFRYTGLMYMLRSQE